MPTARVLECRAIVLYLLDFYSILGDCGNTSHCPLALSLSEELIFLRKFVTLVIFDSAAIFVIFVRPLASSFSKNIVIFALICYFYIANFVIFVFSL